MSGSGELGWTVADIPDLSGRRAMVTGATSGRGLVTARELARANAEVVLADQDPGRLREAESRLRAELPAAALVPVRLDLADLASVRRAASETAALGPLDILVNSAAVTAPVFERTAEGFELQFGSNHLGHFALTGMLLDPLVASGRARVVTVSSLTARSVRTVSLEDRRRQQPGRYRRWNAYAQSKLANLLFAVELDRRARAAGLPVTSVAAHPGWIHPDIDPTGVGRGPGRRAIGIAVMPLIGQRPEEGAAPQLRASAEPGLTGRSYLGPGGPFELHGPPRRVRMPGPAQDAELATALWSMSEKATGVSYP